MVERGPAGLALPREVSSSCPEGAAATCVSPLGTLGRWPLWPGPGQVCRPDGAGWTESASLPTPVPGVCGVSKRRAVGLEGLGWCRLVARTAGCEAPGGVQDSGPVTAQARGSAGLPQGTGAGIGSREALCPLTPGPERSLPRAPPCHPGPGASGLGRRAPSAWGKRSPTVSSCTTGALMGPPRGGGLSWAW